jgi:hypothetical protein
MANTLKTQADNLARVSAALVSKDLSLANTVNRDFDADFAGKRGATVNVRTPAALTANTRTIGTPAARTTADVVESTQAVALTADIWHGASLTDEDLTLKLEDFSRQILAPQTLAVAEAIEGLVVAKLQSVTENAALDTAYIQGDVTTIVKLFTLARKTLRDMGAPLSGLYAAVGTGVYLDLLNAGALQANNISDNSGTAAGVVGRLAGFTIIESNRLASTEAIFYHRDALTLVLRAPVVPQGATAGASVIERGWPMRYIFDYDPINQNDRSFVNVYAGTALMNTQVSSTGTPVNFVVRVNDGAGT